MKKAINMTLDDEVIKESKKKIEKVGGKLSGLIENLLKKFNKGEINL